MAYFHPRVYSRPPVTPLTRDTRKVLDRIEILGHQFRILDLDIELFLEEIDQLEHPGRVDEARIEEGRVFVELNPGEAGRKLSLMNAVRISLVLSMCHSVHILPVARVGSQRRRDLVATTSGATVVRASTEIPKGAIDLVHGKTEGPTPPPAEDPCSSAKEKVELLERHPKIELLVRHTPGPGVGRRFRFWMFFVTPMCSPARRSGSCRGVPSARCDPPIAIFDEEPLVHFRPIGRPTDHVVTLLGE